MAALLLMLYIAIASACIFCLIVAADKYADWDGNLSGNIPWIMCGLFWPVALVPAVAYIAAIWWIEYREDSEWTS